VSDKLLRAALHLSNGQIELMRAVDELSGDGHFDNTIQEIRKTVLDLDKSSKMLHEYMIKESERNGK